jgi:hypothetical protein
MPWVRPDLKPSCYLATMRQQSFGRRMPAAKAETSRSSTYAWLIGAGFVSILVFSLLRNDPPRSAATSVATSTSTLEVADICRASIAALMGRPVNIIKTEAAYDDIVYVGYVRPSDGTVWKQRCRVGNGTVVWADSVGRWRDSAKWDEIITYTVTDHDLAIAIGYPGQSDQDIKRFRQSRSRLLT